MFKQRMIVDVGDLAVSNRLQVILSTYALGPCVGVVAYDPIRKIGGVLHIMLPHSSLSPDRAARQPSLFADTGLPHFFDQLGSLGVKISSLRVLVAGGANVTPGLHSFHIGELNSKATLAYLKHLDCFVRRVDVGGVDNRSIHLEIDSGSVTTKTPKGESLFDLAA